MMQKYGSTEGQGSYHQRVGSQGGLVSMRGRKGDGHRAVP